MSLVTESLEKRRDELAEQQAAKEDKPKIGPSGNKISMESVGSIKQAYVADRVEATNSITGKGYNLLTAPMWSAKHKPRGSIIDFTGLSNAILPTEIRQTKFVVVTESSRSRVAKKFAQKSSGSFAYGWFSASFSQSYEESSEVSEEKAYTKIWVEYLGMMEELATDEWMSHLNPVFWKDLNNKAVSPKTLFNNYGTHVIVRGYYGGNMDLFGTTVKKATDSTKKIEASVTAAVQSYTVSGGASAETSSSKSSYKLNIEGEYTGGSGGVPGSLDDFPAKASAWLDSLKDEKKWSFCGVPKGDDSLYPIWELAELKARRDELRDYFEAELVNSQGLLEEYESFITDIKIVWGKNKSEAEILAYKWQQQNYKFDTLRNHDLNYHAGDGTGYIYIGYKRETREQMRESGHKPITNLFIYNGSPSSRVPMSLMSLYGYISFDQWKAQYGANIELDKVKGFDFSFVGKRPRSIAERDVEDISNLNTGASGLLLLCYTRDPRFTPLTALGVYNEDVSGERQAYHASGEWIDVPARGPFGSEPRCSTNYKKSEGVYLVFKRAEELFDPTPSEN